MTEIKSSSHSYTAKELAEFGKEYFTELYADAVSNAEYYRKNIAILNDQIREE